jgi:hypothetical protein
LKPAQYVQFRAVGHSSGLLFSETHKGPAD